MTAVPAGAEVPLPGAMQVLGSVRNAARPVANALVIALNLADFAATQTYTTSDGTFALPPLPSGIYKIVAVKPGFLPAITTLLPTRPSQKITLALENEKGPRKKTASQELWEIRGSLPPDVLRELDALMGEPAAVAFQAPRFQGEMRSLTGVATADAPGFAQTEVGVRSRIGEKAKIGVRGNVHRIDDPADDERFGAPLAESAAMAMEFSPGEHDVYRITSLKTWWRYRDGAGASGQADVRAHDFEWEHGPARVHVRYFGHQNLFAVNPAGSDLFEITGDTTVLQTGRNDISVSLRVTQENLRSDPDVPLRLANISANGAVDLSPSFVLQYGLASRIGAEGTEWAPRTGLEWRFGKSASLVASGMYKVGEREKQSVLLPMIIAAGRDDTRVLPRYTWSFGVVSGEESSARFSAVATITAVDAPLRVLLADGFEPFWDGLHVDADDVRRDLRVSYRRELGGKFSVDVATSAGTASKGGKGGDASKVYLTGDLQSIYLPTGTSLVVSYRGIRQPQPARAGEYRSQRVNVRMAQPLQLPLDLTLLVGLEVVRAENSPFLVDPVESDGVSRKYVGGLALNF
ncbi:MAG TPA: carboxypeptidase-like regulatory domain-containing protein [Thermoanaerobaculia bacterium]|nr:carboxypeptidase-like regulatory domain-containing protein [Thermoanaerobaculia bacterium]